MKIAHFVPKASTPQDNLAAFIETTRPLLEVYPGVRSWDETPWDLIGVVNLAGRGNGRTVVTFTNYDAIERGTKEEMSEPFLSFAKAYFLYWQALVPTKSFGVRVTALRALEKALVEICGTSHPHLVTPSICNRATELLRKYAGAYRMGRQLNLIVSFLSDNRLASPFQWVSPIARPKDRNRVGKEADDERAKKLPSQAALEALPQCFNLATEPRDVVVSSIAALLCTAPDRISEVFSLPVECEVEDVHKGKPIYGLRWHPEKGADPMVKWIAPTMVEVAREAIRRLREIGQPARMIAKWYEDNPTRIYLPSGTEHLRDREFLLMKELTDILGVTARTAARGWVDLNGVPTFASPDGRRAVLVRFEDVERAVLVRLPRQFPVIDQRTGLKYSEALLVLRPNEIDSRHATIRCLVEPISTSQIARGLIGGQGGVSIFEKFGFKEPDGYPIRVSSHQFRHWLNTLAHRGGMSQLDIAKWSGRKDVRQNQYYDHMTSDEFVEITRALVEGDDRLFGGLAELAAKVPLSRNEFLALAFPTAHVTEIGFCVHDFTMLPCQQYRDCMNCSEHVCVKGDRVKTGRIKAQLELAETQLVQAERALADGYQGADRWHEHHLATVLRLRNLMNVLEDPSIPEGTLIRLANPNEFSAVRLAVKDRMLTQPPQGDAFDELQALLGGE